MLSVCLLRWKPHKIKEKKTQVLNFGIKVVFGRAKHSLKLNRSSSKDQAVINE